jgi:hypothetical protein
MEDMVVAMDALRAAQRDRAARLVAAARDDLYDKTLGYVDAIWAHDAIAGVVGARDATGRVFVGRRVDGGFVWEAKMHGGWRTFATGRDYVLLLDEEWRAWRRARLLMRVAVWAVIGGLVFLGVAWLLR